jgi:hypothetical protein
LFVFPWQLSQLLQLLELVLGVPVLVRVEAEGTGERLLSALSQLGARGTAIALHKVWCIECKATVATIGTGHETSDTHVVPMLSQAAHFDEGLTATAALLQTHARDIIVQTLKLAVLHNETEQFNKYDKNHGKKKSNMTF